MGPMTDNPLSLSTELDAVNMMLRGIGEARVTTLADPTHEDAHEALTVLRHWNMTVQEEGWRFNTRLDFTLTRDGNNELVCPVNTLRVELPKDNYEDSISFLDNKIINARTGSTTWDKDLRIHLTLLYDYERLPQAARNYITQCAGHEFLSNEPAAAQRAGFTRERLTAARSMLRRTEGLIRKPNMFNGSLHAVKFQTGRQPYYLN